MFKNINWPDVAYAVVCCAVFALWGVLLALGI